MNKPLHERPLVTSWRVTTDKEKRNLRPDAALATIFGMRWTTDNPNVNGGSWYDKSDARRIALDIEAEIKRAPEGATEIPWYCDTRITVETAMEIRSAVRRVVMFHDSFAESPITITAINTIRGLLKLLPDAQDNPLDRITVQAAKDLIRPFIAEDPDTLNKPQHAQG